MVEVREANNSLIIKQPLVSNETLQSTTNRKSFLPITSTRITKENVIEGVPFKTQTKLKH
jgi:hypothetical protein